MKTHFSQVFGDPHYPVLKTLNYEKRHLLQNWCPRRRVRKDGWFKCFAHVSLSIVLSLRKRKRVISDKFSYLFFFFNQIVTYDIKNGSSGNSAIEQGIC